ncbi:hypothetical protein ACFV3T_05660 [Streptomyces albidoflavus]
MTDRRPIASWFSVLLLALVLGTGLVVVAHVAAPEGARHVFAGADGLTSPVERRNQSFVTGGLLALLPSSVLLTGTVVRRARYGRVIAARSEEEPPALRPTSGEARAAAGVAVAVAGAALWTLGPPASGPAPGGRTYGSWRRCGPGISGPGCFSSDRGRPCCCSSSSGSAPRSSTWSGGGWGAGSRSSCGTPGTTPSRSSPRPPSRPAAG